MIEKATENDLDQIVTLKLKMFEDMGVNWLLAENAPELIKTRYLDSYAQDTAQHFVIRNDETIVGVTQDG